MLKVRIISVCCLIALLIGTAAITQADLDSYVTISNKSLGSLGNYTEVMKLVMPGTQNVTAIDAHATTYSGYRFRQRADLGNGNFQVSPETLVYNNIKTNLPFYDGYTTVAGNYLYLHGSSYSTVFGDTLNGKWYH